MSRQALLIVALLLMGCGKPNPSWGEFAPYVQRFQDYAVGHSAELPVDVSDVRVIRVDKLDGLAVGVCQYGSPNTVKILGSYWDKADESYREELVLHELGHCSLLLDHDETLITVNGYSIPASVMYPYVLYESWYAPNRDYYWEQLFERFIR